MKKNFFNRSLEILPGALTWTTFITPVILSFIAPVFITVAIIIYAIYWLFKTLIMSYHLIKGYYHFHNDNKKDWLSLCKKDFPSDWQRIYHMLVIPTYMEELTTLRLTFQALANSDYPQDKLIVVLGTEERDKEQAAANAKALEKEFGQHFHKLIVTIHPASTPGEVKGKGGNITYAARQAKANFIDPQKIPYEDIIVTTLDADHRVDRHYFTCLTHTYLSTPNPTRKSFQPIPLFFNNIWQAAFPMRLIAMGSSFWQMIEATRPHRLRNFASHAQSFAALVETDFWSVTSIVEDGHQYWRSYFCFHGNYSVVPIFIPIYQDAILAGNFWDSAKEQYLQKRRWAWGASDIPFAVQAAIKDKQTPFLSKWMQILRLIEGHHSWATASLVLAVVGWLPILLNVEYRTTVIAYNFPTYYRYILTIAMIGMIITLTISTILIPPRPATKKHISYLTFIKEWILTPFIMPITNILFGSIPAIESQTRLMLGKYLGEFRVTVKKPVATDNIAPSPPNRH